MTKIDELIEKYYLQELLDEEELIKFKQALLSILLESIDSIHSPFKAGFITHAEVEKSLKNLFSSEVHNDTKR